MHSPILYMSKEKESLKDLSIPSEKEEFLDDSGIDSFDESFDSYVPNSDWWIMNTLAYEGWHRGQWDIKEILETTMTEIKGEAVTLMPSDKNIFELEFTPDDARRWLTTLGKETQSIAKELNNIDYENDDLKSISRAIGMVQYKLRTMNDESTKYVNVDEGYIETIDDVLSMIAATNESRTIYVYGSIQGDYHY